MPVSEASGTLPLAYQVEDLGLLPPYASASSGTALNQAGQGLRLGERLPPPGGVLVDPGQQPGASGEPADAGIGQPRGHPSPGLLVPAALRPVPM
jgi:hypothetical protein